MPVTEGKPAPDFTLPDASGASHSLKDYRGKTVVLYFYPKDDTPGCTKEACGFRDLSQDFDSSEVVILGVSPDGAAEHQAFADKFNLPFTLLSDEDKAVMSEYEAFGEKMMYGKKTAGVIRSTVIIGPDGVVRKRWKKVPKAEPHPEKVLEAVRSLSA